MNKEIAEKYGPDPIKLFQEWFNEAAPLEPNDPGAICLATADKNGHPSARMLLLKEIDENGFKFHTHEGSEKGRDIAENAHVAFCIYWKSTRKQIRITGRAQQISDTESDEYYKTRPRERAIGAWASEQSQPFEKQKDLAEAITAAQEKYGSMNEIPRPPHWKGYRIIPDSIEFWIGNKDRLHTRFIYKKDGETWTASWLYP